MSIVFLGTENILKWIKEILSNYINLSENSITKSENIYRLSFSKRINVIIFYNLMKNYNLPLLQRKWEKLINFQ